MKKNIINVQIIVLVFLVTIGLIGITKVEASSTSFSSNIDGINESKYPGYKEKIKELQKTYPNIKLLYTGLDWSTVIKNEYGEPGRNVVQASQAKEWKEGDKTYDTGWYRASEEAVEYVMDPRNWLDTSNIFQFQKLDTTYGTNKDDLKKVLIMQKAQYLCDDSISDAFASVAKNNKINAYHLITRVIQEQGRTGTSVLSSGAKYLGVDGVTYEGYYNLFNIGATGNGRESVYTNGLERAKREGWTSLVKSITGGGNFVKNNYIDVGQNTLYLQKFSVYNTKGQLYYHQYMTNLLAAKSEASIMLSNYMVNNVQNDKSFEFIIPIYENMPKQPSPEPAGEYYGNINTQTINIGYIKSSNGEGYISGNVDIAEWVNNVCKTPRQIPKLTLKSTDGKVSKNIYVSYLQGIRYYFDVNIENLDLTKEYYIEAKLEGDKNLSLDANKTQKLSLPTEILTKEFKNKTIKIRDNKIIFSDGDYIGNINTSLQQVNIIKNGSGESYISGYVYIAEWINNECKTPKSVPEIRLKSTDGSVNMITYISYEDGINYYFDKMIQYLDVSKEYYLEAKLVTEENIALESNKVQKIGLGTKKIGEFNNITVNAKDDNFVLNYIGEINTNLTNVGLTQNGAGDTYIYGNIEIAEWVNNVCNEPYKTPELRIKSTDGTVNTNAYISKVDGLKYYFDKNIEGWDVEKEYYIEAELVSNNNIASEKQKTQTVRLKNSTIGKQGTITVTANNNKFKISDSSLYKGNINTELYKINVIQTGTGLDYITGNIYIAEWVNNECRTPSTTPKMTLKSTDGTFATGMYVSQIDGINYYFDKCIKGIDESKEYYIEVELTNKKNTAPETNKKQTAKVKQQGKIGTCKNGDRVVVKGNNIKIEADTYKGNINTELYRINVIQTGTGLNYITGNIYIAEWVNNECRTPSATPKMTLKSTDGTFKTEMYVSQIDGINYYFDKCINGIDKSKEYYIEVELTGKNNISAEVNKKQTAKVKPQGEIGTLKSGDIVKTSGNNIKIEVKTSIKKIQRSVQEEKKAVVENKEETDTKQNGNKENTDSTNNTENTEVSGEEKTENQENLKATTNTTEETEILTNSNNKILH